MMIRTLTFLLLVAGSAAAQPGLPADVERDPAIPTPASVLGFEVGDWHARPDQIARYFEVLAESSDRVTLQTYGRTHEQRPLLLATITAPARQARIDEVRRAHVERAHGGRAAEDGDPAVVWLGYSVHGNEPSGANAALLVAWHLASARGPGVERLLEELVILVDPMINPDGLARFAHWVNTHRGVQLVTDGSHREHREAWPGGRTNHYWFDLNRDWLLLTHPESRGRIAQFQRWKPNLLTDHHEMGTSSTYFFQPGVPSRTNPLTPARNQELTARIAAHHAAALDAAGELYYTEETFDDFYYGKGSTYPDVQGCIGILFEQASSRGHLQENSQGELSFPMTIANQVRTSLSSLAAALDAKDDLLAYQSEFYRDARAEGAAADVGAWVFGDARDPMRVHEMADILLRHDVAVHRLARAVEADGARFEPGAAYLVPADQPQYRLAKSLFERRTEFEDHVFYDVSAWTLPLAFGLPFAELPDAGAAGARVAGTHPPVGTLDAPTPDGVYAYLCGGHGRRAPRALRRLQAADVHARVATRPFEAETRGGRRAFDHGTIVVPVGRQELDPVALHARMRDVAALDGLDVFGVATGLTAGGVDLGSPIVRPLEPPRPLLVAGDGVSSYEAGEVWHQLDVRWELPVAMTDVDALGRADLHERTHLIVVSGGYGALSERDVERVADWVRGGGIVVALDGGARWAERALLDLEPPAEEEEEDGEDDEPGPPPAYEDYESLRARSIVGGAIFETRLDPTHPVAFGVGRDTLPVFRRGTDALVPDDDPFATVATYADEPLLAGYASEENVARLAGAPAVIARRVGAGAVITIADDPVFRGVFRGSSRLLANALWFGGVIKRTSPLQDR